MFGFKRKEKPMPAEFGGYPRYDIVPETHGRWNFRVRDYRFIPCGYSIKPMYYMRTIETYATREEAEADAAHLHLKR